MDPENASSGTNRRNRANPLRARFWQVHRYGKRHRGDCSTRAACGSADDLHLRRGESLPSWRRADIVQLDRILVHYGPQAKPARDLQRDVVIAGIDSIWSERTFHTGELDPRTMNQKGARFFDEIEQLSPQNDYQRSLLAQALQISADLGHIRSLLLEQTGGSIPMPFLVVLVFWLSMIFLSFGLFAPVNPTVVAILLVCAVSVAARFFSFSNWTSRLRD